MHLWSHDKDMTMTEPKQQLWVNRSYENWAKQCYFCRKLWTSNIKAWIKVSRDTPSGVVPITFITSIYPKLLLGLCHRHVFIMTPEMHACTLNSFVPAIKMLQFNVVLIVYQNVTVNNV